MSSQALRSSFSGSRIRVSIIKLRKSDKHSGCAIAIAIVIGGRCNCCFTVFVKENMGYDATKYLQKILTVDFLSLNTDRHFNNLGFIVHKDGTVTDAPVFDNGQGLLNGNVSINKYLSIAENTKRVIARPFSGSHRKMIDYVGVGFKLDVDGAKKWLQEQPQTFYRDVLLYRLDFTGDILQSEMKLF